MMPGLSQAQHGGGHGGGGHGGGGGHFGGGGAHFAGSGAHFSGAQHGAFNHGGIQHGGFNHGGIQHGGFNHGGVHHDGFNHGRGWWNPGYYGYYGAWPYYYGAYPYSYDTYNYGSASPAYDSSYYGAYGDVTPSYPDGYTGVTPPAGSYQSFYPPPTVGTDTAPVRPDNSAHVTVSVPADAEIWFQGTKMTSTGAVREYQSPPLTPGSQYTYEIRARWSQNGHEVTQTEQVEVAAGSHVNVQFPVQPAKAPAAPSH
jgi:uncharacterized protein (TIGR03000 family)